MLVYKLRGLLAYLAGAASMLCALGVGAYGPQAFAGAVGPAAGLMLRQATGGATAVQLNDPQGVALDALGNLYVADTGNHRIVKLSPAGQTLAEWRLGPASASAPGGIALDNDGNVYVADWQAGQVFKLAPTGLLLAQWGAPGSELGAFDGPRALALDAEGNVYVADSGNGRIQKLAPTGEAVAQWGAAPPRPATAGASDDPAAPANEGSAPTPTGAPTRPAP
jgi:DNA-binding beta-propeller fold protein YncE